MNSILRRAAVALVLALLVAGLARLLLGGADPLRVSADFADTTGVYVGNEVHYLGVPIGTVVRVEPRGTEMRVHMEVDDEVELPADAGAEILQSSLVTDRLVELGPPYTEGPKLASGSTIPSDRTRSPAGVDEIVTSIDELVLALDQSSPNGKDIGDVLSTTADLLEGNGARIGEALVAGDDAMRRLNGRSEQFQGLLASLHDVTTMVAERDATLRSFTDDVATSAEVVAEQRRSITATVAALDHLTEVSHRFLAANDDVITEDLSESLRLLEVVADRRDSLTEALDVFPLMAENIARAYDFNTGRLRVQFSFDVGPFHRVLRSHVCANVAGELCSLLVRPDGTGALDMVLDTIWDVLPKDFP